MRAIGIGLAFAVLFVSGCTVSQSDYEGFQEKLREDPALKRAVVSHCIETWKPLSEQDKARWAKFMRASAKSAARVYCTRLLNAVAAGRIPYDDARAMERGTLTPELVLIIQGR